MPKLWKTQAEDPPLYLDLVEKPGGDLQLCIVDANGIPMLGGILIEIFADGTAYLVGCVDKQVADRAGITLDNARRRIKLTDDPSLR